MLCTLAVTQAEKAATLFGTLVQANNYLLNAG
jgi:hypothetical protein